MRSTLYTVQRGMVFSLFMVLLLSSITLATAVDLESEQAQAGTQSTDFILYLKADHFDPLYDEPEVPSELLYSYESDLVHGFDNQLIYRNHFEILTDEAVFGRNGISYYMTDALAGVNNRIASNTFECADGFSSISLGSGDPAEWKVYDSNRYISGTPIEIIGNNPPYAYISGAPPSAETSPYDGYVVPDLDIPEYGIPAGPPASGNTIFQVVDPFPIGFR